MRQTVLFSLISVALGLGAPVARAQVGTSDRIGEVALMVGYGGARLSWPSLAEHFASYSAYNRDNGLVSAPTLGNASCQTVGITVAGGWVYLGWQRTAVNTAAIFENKAERQYQVRQGLALLTFEPTAHLGKHIFLAPVLSFGFGHNRVNQYFKYPDGTTSWGTERGNTGQYSAALFQGAFGAKAGATFGHLVVQVRANWQPPRMKTDLSSLADVKPSAFNYIPRSYDQYIRANGSLLVGYDPVKDAVSYDLQAISALLEVGFLLNPAK